MGSEKPYKLASLDATGGRYSRVTIPSSIKGMKPVIFGGNDIVVVAGPCSVETPEIMLATALAIKKAGAVMLRAGAFKPRSSPYAFQGLGVHGLRRLIQLREKTGMPFITEVMDTRDVEVCTEVADVVQIGARNMQNFPLLKAVGRKRKPVLIKRGLSSTIEEWLMSAEYVLNEGNPNVILCERGIRTYERATRNTLDLNAVPVLRSLTHLPIAVDPSHGTGITAYVAPMARAAVAAGCDSIMVEVHPEPGRAISDGQQTLNFAEFAHMMKELRAVARAINRDV